MTDRIVLHQKTIWTLSGFLRAERDSSRSVGWPAMDRASHDQSPVVSWIGNTSEV
jgi:hypothetical protein